MMSGSGATPDAPPPGDLFVRAIACDSRWSFRSIQLGIADAKAVRDRALAKAPNLTSEELRATVRQYRGSEVPEVAAFLAGLGHSAPARDQPQ